MILRIALLTGTLALPVIASQDTSEAKRETPFFCNLKALNAEERREHLQRSQRLAESVLKTVEIADGYAFEIDGSRVSVTDLAAWTVGERRCCPFFDFTLEWRRENGPVTLRLTGREGVKAFIRSEFSAVVR
jgi:hypothetical protein